VMMWRLAEMYLNIQLKPHGKQTPSSLQRPTSYCSLEK
jgi:hypothetical protein